MKKFPKQTRGCKFEELQSDGSYSRCNHEAEYVASKYFSGRTIRTLICGEHVGKSNGIIAERCRKLGLRINECLRACLMLSPFRSSEVVFA